MANSLNTNGMNLKVGITYSEGEARAKLNSVLNKLELKSTIQIPVEIDGERFVKTVKTYQDKMKNLVEETTLYNGAGKTFAQTITNITTAEERANAVIAKQANNTKKLTEAQQQLNSTTKHGVSIFKDFTDTFMKMAKFNTINLIYDGIINSMSEMIEVTEKLNAATVEFQKVSDLSGESLSKYKEHLGELGAEVGRTMSEMIESSTTFRKSGFTDEESAQLAKINAMFQNIADEELSASDAAQILISTMKGFNLTTNEVEHIADVINEVSNNFAVSSSDISSGLANVSAVAKMAGNSIEETTGMLTAMVEISQSAGKSSRGLRQIITRLTQTLDESSSTGKKLKEIYSELGIEITDSEGNLRSTYDILRDLAKQWDGLSTNQQQYIALTSSGANQIQNFTALMDNFDNAIRATETAFTSAGSAMKESQTYMENSIEAHKKALQAEYENLVNSIPLEQIEKKIIDIGTALLKLANSDTVRLIVKVTALVTIGGLLLKGLTSLAVLIPTLSSEITAWAISVVGLNASLTTTETVMAALTTTMLASPLFWGAVAVASIVAIVKVVDALTVSFEEQREALEKSTKGFKEAQNEVKTLQEKLENIAKQLDEVNQKKLQITDANELNRLSQQTKELTNQERILKNQLAIAQSKAEAAERELRATAQQTQQQTTTARIQGTNVHNGKTDTILTATGTRQEILGKAVKEMAELNNKIQANEAEIQRLTQIYGEGSSQVGVYTARNEELQQKLWDLKDGTIQYAEDLTKVIDTLGDFTVTIDGQTYSVQQLLDLWGLFGGTSDDVVNANSNIADSAEEAEEAEQKEADATKALEEAFDRAIKPLSDIENNYSTVAKAVKEFNEQGGFSASTIKKITELDSDWLEVLTQVLAGEANLNEASQLVAEAQKQEAISTLQAQAAQDMKNVAIGDYEALSPIAQQAIANLTSATKEEAAAAKEAAGAYLLEATALDIKNQVDPNGTGGSRRDEIYAEIDAIMSKYQGMIDNMSAWTLDLGDTSSSTAKNTKDAWVEAFEEEQRLLKHSLEMNEITEYEYYQKLIDLNEKYFGEISGKHQKYIKEYQENEEEIYKGLKSVYDKVASYLKEAIEQGYEDAINALKKEEKQILEEIKAQIEALKDEKKKVLQDITDQINSLKKKKDKVQDYWNSQIDKIKESNEQLQKQNELLEKQQALQRAKAQKVMVMKGGKFQLSENESAVAQAEQSLAEYEDQTSYEQQISEMEKLRDKQLETIDDRIEKLEEYKDYMERYYDEQIDALERHRDAVEKEYEKQIEALQEELDAFKKGAEQQSKIEEARLAAQVLGINSEAELFKISLENAKKYVDAYNSIMKSKGALNAKGAFQAGEGGGNVNADFQQAQAPALSSNAGNVSTQLRASGDASFRNDEVALVGESPNAELILGANLNRSVNSGTLVHLAKGSGVVNAESTATLAGLLNSIEPQKNDSFGRSVQQVFSFSNLTLPNVTDANSFVNALSNKFNNYAIQYGNIRQ